MVKKYLCMGISLILLAGLVGCATAGGAQKVQKLKLNEVVHSVFYAPQYVALEKGFFSDEGLEIEIAVGQGADTQVAQRNIYP